MKLNNTQLSTIRAALKFYSENGQGDPSNREAHIHEIAIGCETHRCTSIGRDVHYYARPEDEANSLDQTAIEELYTNLQKFKNIHLEPNMPIETYDEMRHETTEPIDYDKYAAWPADQDGHAEIAPENNFSLGKESNSTKRSL